MEDQSVDVKNAFLPKGTDFSISRLFNVSRAVDAMSYDNVVSGGLKLKGVGEASLFSTEMNRGGCCGCPPLLPYP